MVVGAGPATGPVGVRAEDVVKDHEVVVAELLDGARVGGDRVGIGADLELREDSAELQRSGYGLVTLIGTPTPLTRTNVPPASGRA